MPLKRQASLSKNNCNSSEQANKIASHIFESASFPVASDRFSHLLPFLQLVHTNKWHVPQPSHSSRLTYPGFTAAFHNRMASKFTLHSSLTIKCIVDNMTNSFYVSTKARQRKKLEGSMITSDQQYIYTTMTAHIGGITHLKMALSLAYHE